jgi:methyl-accepting chemotaxis protein
MAALARGDQSVEVNGAERQDEIGAMAAAVQVFKENARKVTEMTEGERVAGEQRRAERAAMMQELQRSFGEVVDAAIAGDFTQARRGGSPTTNSMAGRERQQPRRDRGSGPRRDRRRACALAETDLTRRVNGQYQGAFERLKDDTNQVAEKLSDIVRQLQGHLAGAQDGDRRDPLGRQRPQRAHDQAGGDHRGNVGGHGAAGHDRAAERQRARKAASMSAAGSVTRTAEEGGAR